MLPNYAGLKERINIPETEKVDVPLHICKLLLKVAEACEVCDKNLGCLMIPRVLEWPLNHLLYFVHRVVADVS